MDNKPHVSVADFFTSRAIIIQEFMNVGGDMKFLNYLMVHSLFISANQKNQDKRFDYLKKYPKYFRVISRRAAQLAEDLEIANKEVYEEPHYEHRLIKRLQNIAQDAELKSKQFKLQIDRGGQASHLRRYYFLGAMLPYIRHKKLKFKSQEFQWFWLEETSDWLDNQEIRNLERLESLSKSSEITLADWSAAIWFPNKKEINRWPELRSWWSQTAKTKNAAVLEETINGARAYIHFVHEKQDTPHGFKTWRQLARAKYANFTDDEKEYIRCARKFLAERGCTMKNFMTGD
jgi:hypothetical protein